MTRTTRFLILVVLRLPTFGSNFATLCVHIKIGRRESNVKTYSCLLTVWKASLMASQLQQSRSSSHPAHRSGSSSSPDSSVTTKERSKIQWSRLSIKKSLFPVQWVVKTVASWAAAIFFFHIFFCGVGKYCPFFFFFSKNEQKVSSRTFFSHPAATPET